MTRFTAYASYVIAEVVVVANSRFCLECGINNIRKHGLGHTLPRKDLTLHVAIVCS